MKTIIYLLLLLTAAQQLTAQEALPLEEQTPLIAQPIVDQPTAAQPAAGELLPTIDESELIIGDGDQISVDAAPLDTFRFVDLLRMILVLAAVLVTIYLVFRLLKRFSGGTKRPSTGSMRLMDTLTLATNRSLHIVEVGQQLFMIGVGEHGVSLVAEIEEQETIDEIRLKGSVEREQVGPNFGELVGNLFPKRDASIKVDPFQFLRRSRERLKGL